MCLRCPAVKMSATSKEKENKVKRYLISLCAFLLLLSGCSTATAYASSATNSTTSTLNSVKSSCVSSGTNTMQGQIDGANYTIAVPSNWNGTLFLYSHGYTPTSAPLAN